MNGAMQRRDPSGLCSIAGYRCNKSHTRADQELPWAVCADIWEIGGAGGHVARMVVARTVYEG